MMSEMPNDRRGGDNMATAVKKAASAPEGDNERLRKPWPARRAAMRAVTNGMSDTLKAIRDSSRMTARGKLRNWKCRGD